MNDSFHALKNAVPNDPCAENKSEVAAHSLRQIFFCADRMRKRVRPSLPPSALGDGLSATVPLVEDSGFSIHPTIAPWFLSEWWDRKWRMPV